MTATRNVDSISAACAVYVTPFASAMSAQASPVSSHRCHWIVNVREPASQVPFAAVSVWPEAAVPAIVGRVVAAGGGGGDTTAVRSEAAVLEPLAPIAVTVTRSVDPMSAAATVYCSAVAPVTAAQPAPRGSQRSHWTPYVRVSVGATSHVPSVAVSVWPAAAVPVTAGSAVATGAGRGPTGETGAATTTADGCERAVADPVSSVAVTFAARASR